MKNSQRVQVLLQQDVPFLGLLGDVVDVAPGYARNYLLPKKIAVPVTNRALNEIAAAREARLLREEEELTRVRRQAELLDGYLCVISVRATDQGHLFGSVTAQTVADHLVEVGFEGIRSAAVSLDRHIEELGDYDVELMLHPRVRVTILVRVVPVEEEQA